MKQTSKARSWSITLRLAATTTLIGACMTANAQDPREVVLVKGTASGSEDMFFETESTDSANPWGVLDELCTRRDWVRAAVGLPPDVSASATNMFGTVGAVLGSLGQQAMPDPDPGAQEAFDDYESFCNERGTEDSFDILYTQCSMTMWSQGGVLRWVLPPGGDATMNILTAGEEFCMDCACVSDPISGPEIRETYYKQNDDDECRAGFFAASSGRRPVVQMVPVNLERVMQADYIPKGTATGFEITPAGGGSEHLGVPTRKVDFKYEGTMNPQMMGAANSAGSGAEGFSMGEITMVTEGTAYVNSTDVPGAYIVKDFYKNLQQKVVPGSAADTLFGAMFRQMAGVIKEGFPLSLSQETAVRIEGMPEMLMPTIGQKAFSETNITGVLHFLSDAEWCSVGAPPSDWKVVTLDDMMSTGTESAPGPAGGPQMSDEQAEAMASAMQQSAEAMENMAPEQREMLEQFGLGDMMQQMTGGTNPAAQQQAAAATAAGGAAARSRAGSNMPPAEELNSGNVTESIQRHLQALGYDVGDTNGEMSMSTSIAISTFQAEKGMAVTGEISPQLLGILSAEVDSRR